jgi:hypothetical protein
MHNNRAKRIEVIVPGRYSTVRAALSSCAIENNQFSIDALDTIRRIEADEPVGPRYVRQLNRFMREQDNK